MLGVECSTAKFLSRQPALSYSDLVNVAFRNEHLSSAQFKKLTVIPTGAGNIADAGIPNNVRKDAESVPEPAVRPSQDNVDYHVGRGGAGNEHMAEKKAEKANGGHVSVADKLKGKLFGAFGKK